MITIRTAKASDIEFIIEGILQAEKSGTDKIGYCNIFNISIEELRAIILQILEEEIEGQEWYLPNFRIAEIDEKQAGCLSVWLENEGGMPSNIIKAQSLAYFLGEKWSENAEKIAFISKINIPRIAGHLQLECIYTHIDFRKKGVAKELIDFATNEWKNKIPSKTVSIQLMGNNNLALNVYRNCGFFETRRSEDLGNSALHLLPGTFKIEVSKQING